MSRRPEMYAAVSPARWVAFGLEMLMLAVVGRAQDRPGPGELPPRVGVSSVTGDLRKAVVLGIRMLGLVLAMRLRPPTPRAARSTQGGRVVGE